jgi:uracil-DNA glycosylase
MIENLKQQLGTWYPVVSHLFDTEWMKNLGRHLGQDIDKLSPPLHTIFRAFTLTPIEKVKVVIIGQDPYPGKGHADGLAFSSGNGTTPKSLQVIFDRLAKLYGAHRTRTTLEDWAEQGVLLLNPVLTTRVGEVNAHKNIGWQNFTRQALNAIPHRVVYLVWGNEARNFVGTLLDKNDNNIIVSCHPAARNGYEFSGHFDHCNRLLEEAGQEPINWV